MKNAALALPILLLAGEARAQAPAPAAAEQATVTWLGHAAFELVSAKGTRILIDPMIAQNPSTPADKKKLGDYKPAAILVTHSHDDHVGDTVAIAKKSGAKVVGAFDHISKLKIADGQKAGGNVGGKVVIDDVTVHLVPAMHGSDPGGRPLGFVVELGGGKSVYHTGDTWIFGDMALIQEIYKPTVVLLQAGGGPFNQDPKTAMLAVQKFLKPEVIVPMHYGTWPVLAQEDEVRKAFEGDKRVRILKPGESFKL